MKEKDETEERILSVIPENRGGAAPGSDHYCSKHHEHIPVNCTICGTLLPDTKSLKEHLKWHENRSRSTKSNDYVAICSTCGCFFAEGRKFNSHKAMCIEKIALDKNKKDVKIDCTPPMVGVGSTSTADTTRLMQQAPQLSG